MPISKRKQQQRTELSNVEAGSMAVVAKHVDGVQYLVKGWVPLGMLTMVLGPPGMGKSAFALGGLARPVIVGGSRWFNGARGPRVSGNVLWCDTEGTNAITVHRIKEWGLPPERLLVPYANDPLLSINLAEEKHLEQVEAVIEKYGARLTVVDSLRGAHGGDENSSKVAEVLKKLADIAERTKSAIVIVHHSRKIGRDEEFSADSSRGSNAIVAMVRSQLGIDQPDHSSEWRRLQMLKENLGLKPQPIGFTIGNGGLTFGASPVKQLRETRRDEAEDWLRDNMEPGQWYSASKLKDEAGQRGYSANALQRARENLGIVKPKHVKKVGTQWQWKLPSPRKRKGARNYGQETTADAR